MDVSRALQEYCQPGRGFNVGVNGGRYQGVCSVDQEDDFLDAYNTGYRLYTLRSNVNRANSQINAKTNELDRIDDRIIANGIEMVASRDQPRAANLPVGRIERSLGANRPAGSGNRRNSMKYAPDRRLSSKIIS